MKIARLGFCVWSFDIIEGCINRKQWIASGSIKIILSKHAVTALSVLCGGHIHGHVLRPQCKSTSSGNGSPGVPPLNCNSCYTVTQTHPYRGLKYYTVWSIWINIYYIIWGGGKGSLVMWRLCHLPLGPENMSWPALFNSSLWHLFCY